MKEKTFLHLHRNDVSMTLGGGSNGHPLSIHSASIGTSRKPAGIKAVIRYMVALFVMLFTLGVGNAWGVNYYGTGRVVAKRFGGDDANFGKVGVKVYTSAGGKTSYTGTYAIDTIPRPTNLPKYSTTGGNVYISCYAQVNEASGYTFEGWYSDPECETLAPDCGVIDSDSKGVYYVYKVSRSSIPHGSSDTNTSAATAAVMYTVYAKFVKGSTTNKFQTQLTVATESTSKGVVDVSKTGVKPIGSNILQYDIDSEHPLTRGKDTRTVTGDQVETESTDTFQTYYVYAQPLRGYQFKKWTPGGTNVTLASEDYCGTGSNCYLSAYNVSIDNTATKTNGVYGLTGTLTAEFESITANRNFSVKKEKNRGSVTVYYSNWGYDSGSKVGRKGKVDDLTALGLSDETRSYSGFYSTDEVTLTATPADKFLFSGWVVERESKPDSFLTTDATLTSALFEDDLVFKPIFVPDPNSLHINENDYFLVGNSTCQTFEQAISAATQGQHKTILQLKNYTVPAGNYTIPEGVTLLIPYAADQVAPALVLPRVENQNATDGVEYRRLTLSSGVHIDVYGTIEVSGQQATGVNAAGGEVGIGCPTGGYGCMYMGAGSSITLNNGAMLRGWGFVLGDTIDGEYQCEIDARRGSIVREQFQMMDWKGGTYTMGMTDGLNSGTADTAHRVLPINQYYIQNVEVPVKYRPGAKLQANASVFLNGTFYGMTLNNMTFNIDNVGIIGAKYTNSQDAAIFLMNDEDDSEDTWVRKYYDPATDQQVYEINNSAYLGSLELTVLNVPVSSTEYKLPITNNFKIHLLNGQMEITQHTEFLAGSELMMDKKSTVTIPAGVNVYLYDKEDWGHYISATRNANSTFTFASGTTVRWRPGGRPTVRRDAVTDTVKIEDTKFTVSGTLDVQGNLFTTTHGATIISTNADAGTVKFSAAAPANNTVSQVISLPAGSGNGNSYKRIPCTSAKLTNGNGTFTTTAETAAGNSFCFTDGAWGSFVQEDVCFVSKTVNAVKTYYAKPKDYVALSSGTEDSNHLFYSSDLSRTFINLSDNDANCQWWEVEKIEDNLYHCLHNLNDKYYYWNGDFWEEKKFKVSWVNWDGSPVNYQPLEGPACNYYMVSYNSIPEWLSTKPTRANDASHEYSFDGWTPDLAPVTADVTYMAKYVERDRMYAITFNNSSDELIEVNYCKLGEIPVCAHHPLAANEEWTPAIGAVTGDQVYTLQAKNVDGPFTIRFVNWDGTELLAYDQEEGENAKIASGSTPVYNGATPFKPADNSHAYTFVGWTPSIAPATQNITYTAKFEVQQLSGLNVVDAQTITTDLVIPNVRITTTGSLNVTGSITTTNLYLETDGSTASGQLIADNSLIDATNAFYDLKLNTAARHWHAFGVPWVVNLDVTPLTEVESGRTLVLGRDYEIVYYNGAKRATQGAGAHCWEKVADGTHILQPGKGYMIAFAGHINTVRFAKATGTPVIFNGTVKLQNEYGDGDNNGWNGLANPMAFHAKFTDGPTVGYVHNGEEIGHDGYTECNLENKRMIVGKMVYVQVASNADVTPVQATTGEFVAAPARRTNTGKATDKQYLSLNDYYQVSIADANEQGGSVYVLPEENKEDKYVIGHDLSHLGISDQKAQIWVFRYGTKLALNTTAPIDDVAEYALRVYAPKNGEYTITNNQSPVSDDEYVVYLTRNGEAIWNLSDGAYTTDLTSGVHKEYGLRLSARKTPAVVTGIDEAIVDANGETRKVLINNQVFIIRGNEVYTIDGQMVK